MAGWKRRGAGKLKHAGITAAVLCLSLVAIGCGSDESTTSDGAGSSGPPSEAVESASTEGNAIPTVDCSGTSEGYRLCKFTWTGSTGSGYQSLDDLKGKTGFSGDPEAILFQARGAGGGGSSSWGAYSGGKAGAGGYAQTVLSADDLSGKEIYVYVGHGIGHNGYGGPGGASSIVSTAQLSTFDTTDRTTAQQNAIVVAGGGGGGGEATSGGPGFAGGTGGVAVATTDNPTSDAGDDGHESSSAGAEGDPGIGGNWTGGWGFSSAGTGHDGLGGMGGKAYNAGSTNPASQWFKVAQVDEGLTSSFTSGQGGTYAGAGEAGGEYSTGHAGGGGGAGWGGGGGGAGDCGAFNDSGCGGAGGGSWAMARTYNASYPSSWASPLTENSVSTVVITLAYSGS